MTDISRTDLRKAKRGFLKDSKHGDVLETDYIKNVPIFNYINKLHSLIHLLNEYGIISRQELVSMLPPLMLNVESTDFVLDMCAAPGSKTKQLSEMLNNEGFLVANELDQKRTFTLTHNLKGGLGELLTGNTVVINNDAQHLPEFKFTIDAPEKYYTDIINKCIQKNNLVHLRFDKILCDVPCTGDGAIRKLPNRWKEFKARDGYCLSSLQ